MSELDVKIVKIEVLPHPNADKLELAQIGGEGGYISIVGKGQFWPGDLAIYIPPDSVLPDNIMESLAKNKITMKSSRLRAIKIRGVLSEGLCLSPIEWLPEDKIYEDTDVKEYLGITKYEPPPPRSNIFKSGKGVNNNYENDNFVRYNCVEHFKKYPKILQEGEEVVVTIKRHGTNWRAGWVDKVNFKKTWWQKLKNRIFGEKKKEFLVGSHNKIRYLTKNAIKYESYKTDLYWRATLKYNIESITKQIAEANVSPDGYLPDVVIYGEIVGKNVQKNYSYGVSDGDIEICVFDIMINGVFSDWNTVKHLCDCFSLPTVEEIYVGQWKSDLLGYAEAIDEYNGQKFNREGIVIRPIKERRDHKCGRVIMKFLNPVYLLDSKNTDFH